MRVIVSNPDSIGDLVLREPLFSALAAAGHELVLLTRPGCRAAAEVIAPRARVWDIPVDPYTHRPAVGDLALHDLGRRLEESAPHLLLLAPYVRTWFEEWLLAALPGTRSIGFAGRHYPAAVEQAQGSNTWRLTRAVDVLPHVPEWEKNRLLAEAVFEGPVGWRRPRLVADPGALQEVRGLLTARGFGDDPFWVACVGDSERNRAVNWPAEHWADLLRHALREHGWRFVLVGNAAERAVNEGILAALAVAAGRATLLDEGDLSFARLVGLLALAQGYLGRDSGPMHVAAALDRPVLAVFGGGTWPRFLPLVERGAVYTMAVPCAGCGHLCHLPEAYCIKRVPIEAVRAGLDALATGGAGGLACHELPRPADLALRMEKEAAAAGREQAWLLVQRQRQLDDLQAVLARARTVHLGHPFYGAGNLGDDLTLAGFLGAVRRYGGRFRFTCATPFDPAPQRLRFPEVEWLPYDPAGREAAVRACDAWLGLGDSPFQTDTGPGILDRLAQELAWCRRHKKPMFFLGAGVNTEEEVADPRARALLQNAAHVWARDRRSAALFARAGGKVSAGADPSHLLLQSRPPAAPSGRTLGWVLNLENAALYDRAALVDVLRRLADWSHSWLVQEVRPLPGSEMSYWGELPGEVRSRIDLRVPPYETASVEDLLRCWGAPEVLVSSRYHALLVGAWMGWRLVGVERNAKLAGLLADLAEVPRLPDLLGSDKVLSAIARSATVPRPRLERFAELAWASCSAFFDAVQALPGPATGGPAGLLDFGGPVRGEGWHTPECAGGVWFRWMGREAWVEWTADELADSRLCCHVAHALGRQAVRGVRLLVNGEAVKVKRKVWGGIRLTANIPARLLRQTRGRMRITFVAPATARPCDLNPASKDDRELSLAVSRLELVPIRRRGWLSLLIHAPGR
jgi:ADP-heptose:LPS heptosyltransferase